MAGLPINIPIPAESSVASYDWTEVASGEGYVTFDGFASVTSTATDYHMSNNVLGTGSQTYAVDTSSTASIDFDTTPFNSPRYVQGNALIAFTHAIFASAAGGGKTNAITVAVYHYDGSTETSLGTATCEALTSVANQLVKATRQFVIPLTPKHFKIGDILRIKVTVAWAGGEGNYVHAFCCDPLNRDITGLYSHTLTASTNPTKFQVAIPFKIQL